MDIEAPDFGKRIADNFMSVFDNGELDHSMLREAALEGVLPTGDVPSARRIAIRFDQGVGAQIAELDGQQSRGGALR